MPDNAGYATDIKSKVYQNTLYKALKQIDLGSELECCGVQSECRNPEMPKVKSVSEC